MATSSQNRGKSSRPSASLAVPSIPPIPVSGVPKAQTRWTEAMDWTMLHFLTEEVAKYGKQSENGLRIEQHRKAANHVSQTLGIHIIAAHVQSRFKSLKKQYIIVKHALDASGFGIEFNCDTKYLTAEPDAWERYIQAHPKASSLRGKMFPYQEILQGLIGDEGATGEFSINGHDEGADTQSSRNTFPSQVEDLDADTESAGGETETEDVSNVLNERATRCSPGMSKRRRSRLGLDEIAEPPSFNTLTGICQKIADSFADSLKKQDLPDIPHLTSILTAIPGMTEDLMFPAVDILGADPRMLNTFVGMTDDTIRMRWLRWKLKSIGYPLASEYSDDQTPAP